MSHYGRSKRRRVLVGILGVLVVAATTGWASMTATAQVSNQREVRQTYTQFHHRANLSAASAGFDCIHSNDAGEYWEGEISSNLRKAEEELAAFVTQNPDTTTLLGFCSDHKGLVLSAPMLTGEIESAIISARRHTAPGETIQFATSVSARGPLQKSIDSVAQGRLPAAASMIDASVTRSGEIEVRVRANADPAAVDLLRKSLQQGAARALVRITTVEEPPNTFATTRLNDVAPWNASTRWLPSGISGYCSLGMPLTVDGMRMNLTAAHCVGSSGTHPGNGASVGNQYTTTWTGTLSKYGDWKLLRGSTYANRVFSGSVTSSSYLNIGGARWSLMSYGDGMCTSGSTTGQICRYWVERAHTAYVVEGYTIGYGILLKHGSGPGKPVDNVGFRGGDSGGLCYYNPDGSMRGAGIISATNAASGGTNFYCAWVAGLKAWSPSASF